MPNSSQIKDRKILDNNFFKWSLSLQLNNITGYSILIDNNMAKLEQSFLKLSKSDQSALLCASNHFANHLIKRERNFFADGHGAIRLQGSNIKQNNDLCDLVIMNAKNEIGIKFKPSHHKLKHSNFSDTLDFALDWGLDPRGCSDDYWRISRKIFLPIKKFIEINPSSQWTDFNEKNEIYIAILELWVQEIWRCYGATVADNEMFCKRLISYLFGSHNIYNIIRVDYASFDIQHINFTNKLVKPFAKYPTAIRAIDNLDGSQFSKTIAFNNGFSINFRIHNADKKLNTSLKFAINAISLPSGQFYQQTLET